MYTTPAWFNDALKNEFHFINAVQSDPNFYDNLLALSADDVAQLKDTHFSFFENHFFDKKDTLAQQQIIVLAALLLFNQNPSYWIRNPPQGLSAMDGVRKILLKLQDANDLEPELLAEVLMYKYGPTESLVHIDNYRAEQILSRKVKHGSLLARYPRGMGTLPY